MLPQLILSHCTLPLALLLLLLLSTLLPSSAPPCAATAAAAAPAALPASLWMLCLLQHVQQLLLFRLRVVPRERCNEARAVAPGPAAAAAGTTHGRSTDLLMDYDSQETGSCPLLCCCHPRLAAAAAAAAAAAQAVSRPLAATRRT